MNSPGYGEDTSLASVALNLFGRGSHFPAQMMLMIRKIGRFYQASGVQVSLLQADFNSNYLNYQWYRDESIVKENVSKYKEEETWQADHHILSASGTGAKSCGDPLPWAECRRIC